MPRGRPLPAKLCHRGFGDIIIAAGNHNADRDGRPLSATIAALEIFHFPARSYRQFANKVAQGGAAFLQNTCLDDSVGSTWRRLYELYRRQELESYYQELVCDDARISEGLASGRLVRDPRLCAALEDLRLKSSLCP